jgi:hypothetical protein
MIVGRGAHSALSAESAPLPTITARREGPTVTNDFAVTNVLTVTDDPPADAGTSPRVRTVES